MLLALGLRTENPDGGGYYSTAARTFTCLAMKSGSHIRLRREWQPRIR